MTQRRSATGSSGDGRVAPASHAAGPVAFIPGPVEARLLALVHEAEVFVAHLDMPVADVARVLAARAADVTAALASLRRVLAESGVLHPGDEVASSLDALLALVVRPSPLRPRTRLATHARRIAEAATDLHGDVVSAAARARRRLEGPVLHALRRFGRAHDELQTQLRAATAVERAIRGLRGRALGDRRDALVRQAATLLRRLEERRDRLAAQRQMSAVQWRELDDELRASVEEVGADLSRLLD